MHWVRQNNCPTQHNNVTHSLHIPVVQSQLGQPGLNQTQDSAVETRDKVGKETDVTHKAECPTKL